MSSQSPAATSACPELTTLMPPALNLYTVPWVTPAPATLQMRRTGLPRLVNVTVVVWPLDVAAVTGRLPRFTPVHAALGAHTIESSSVSASSRSVIASCVVAGAGGRVNLPSLNAESVFTSALISDAAREVVRVMGGNWSIAIPALASAIACATAGVG